MAWRNIWRNKIRSLIIMGSVAFGLVAGLFVLSLYKGVLKDRVNSVIHTEVGHLQLHHASFKEDFDPRFVMGDREKILEELGEADKVSAFATRTVSQGMLATGTGSSGVQIIGVDPARENPVSKLDSKIIEGKGLTLPKANPVLIGKKLADKMNLKLNSKLILTTMDRGNNIVSAAFRVSGIYQTDNAPRDERMVFVRRQDISGLLSLGDDFHEVAIILKDDADVDAAKADLKARFPALQIETWEEISAETKLMIDTTDQYSYIFITIIMFALSFGIINSMLMAVLERAHEIGMLLALGMNRLRVFSMILTETIFLTLSGTPLGILVSWLIVLFYGSHGLDISNLGGEAMTSFGFATVFYPEFPWEKIVREMAIVIGVAFISALLPAIKAIRLQPVEALQK